MLQDFVLLMGILYGPTQCTMNIHLLQHLAYYVSRRGPLWAYSCFAFESMNAFIKPLVHGTHHPMEQIGCGLDYVLAWLITPKLCFKKVIFLETASVCCKVCLAMEEVVEL